MNAELMPVQFHGDTVFLVEHNKEPYTPVRPIVENMGLSWQPQHRKLKSNEKRWGVVMMTTPSVTMMMTEASFGAKREMICMPLRKLPAFLLSIDARKVKPELRSKIEMYQEECDKALWDYWTKGAAVNPRSYQSEDGKLPWPGLSMDAIATLCKLADKGGRVSLRALNYFTGLPVDDLFEEFDEALGCGMRDDILPGFIDVCCVLDPQAYTPSSELYRVFCRWHEQNSDKKTPSRKAWGKQMGKRFARRKSNGVKIYEGVRVA